jgi:hypothetical protein
LITVRHVGGIIGNLVVGSASIAALEALHPKVQDAAQLPDIVRAVVE